MAPVSERRPRQRARLVRCPGGYQACIPAPLPPPITWNGELVDALSSATLAAGKLAGEGRRLPNPHLVIRPFLRREAVLSSRIEGTETTLGELFAAEAGGRTSGNQADLREVINYVSALEYGRDRLHVLPLSLRLVRELHERLMRGVRGNAAAPGAFRRSQNWIGPPGCSVSEATYVPPPPTELTRCLDDWERYLHDNKLPPLVHAAVAHAQFEAIHPFLDGNGRVGRLLITLLLVERDVIPTPLLYLSAWFEATRQEYYARLLAVTQEDAWEPWLTYFLRGVALQSADALGRIERINDLCTGWRTRLAAAQSSLPARAVDLFAEQPFQTASGLAARLGVSFTTAQRAIAKLEAADIVSLAWAAKRNRVYCAREILDVLHAPAPSTEDRTVE